MGTPDRAEAQAHDLRRHWVHKVGGEVGSALILRLRQNRCEAAHTPDPGPRVRASTGSTPAQKLEEEPEPEKLDPELKELELPEPSKELPELEAGV